MAYQSPSIAAPLCQASLRAHNTATSADDWKQISPLLTCAVALAKGVSASAEGSEHAPLEHAVGCSAEPPQAGAWLAAPEQMSCSVSLEPDLALRPLPVRPSLLLQQQPCRLQRGMSVTAQQGHRRQGRVRNS